MTNSESKKILVVDDSATMRMLISMTIKKSLDDFVVAEAVNGKDAVEKLKVGDIALMITDINMPEMDGTELVRWVRESLSNDLPIIIVTTEGDERGIQEGKSLGANAYITKPVKGQELKEVIQGLVS